MKINDLLYSDSLGIYALFKHKAPQHNRIEVYDSKSNKPSQRFEYRLYILC